MNGREDLLFDANDFQEEDEMNAELWSCQGEVSYDRWNLRINDNPKFQTQKIETTKKLKEQRVIKYSCHWLAVVPFIKLPARIHVDELMSWLLLQNDGYGMEAPVSEKKMTK